ncbi:MAG: Asp-tRNA(Asn)/Glu-tRNA(Gln) amidotransferase GatCAB subunit C [Rickettsiales bacterium]|jgi:aspartyl-tRNA(Asn)/glutamyl-tRNA(Gln) amidotransferase subunit C|nr:Asp-tRNA(Asn)/Glu-tRNA(Gln) amidotransferase GatCAB subunit C [Rickettsiales bacterium]MBC36243.1 Asp-tRNA(Asn)/Glu-tRNA(Gln) amidotransferase GatCAB subunit C [Rickettsiales bacterium]MBV31455.1 Asp-tRNA(Asn)/Glu-tRNA(Gln) amidotransferase GatCAB subunit C [Rickettsiales bacterium]|tara:strand:+ start:132 stop:413 length:282 start_codon:yes stop_codon:yes gene_type:complete
MNEETVKKIASLAKIEVQKKDLSRLVKELEQIIGWVEQLQEVNTKNVLPMTSVVDVDLPLREDKISDSRKKEDILSNSPKSKEDYFVVPKVIE